jgi:hypothetical protein
MSGDGWARIGKKANAGRMTMNAHGEDSVSEAQLRKAVAKALEQVLDDIASEPTLVIESPQDETQDSAQSVNDILEWLFRRS